MRPHGRVLMVKETPPFDAVAEGWDGVCVLAYDATDPYDKAYRDLVENVRAWRDRPGGLPVGVWMRCAPGSATWPGLLLAENLPQPEYIILDPVQDAGRAWRTSDVESLVGGIRDMGVTSPLGYLREPSATGKAAYARLDRHLAELADFAVSRMDVLHGERDTQALFTGHPLTYVAVTPGVGNGWLVAVTESMHRSWAALVWHAGIPETRRVAHMIPLAPPVPQILGQLGEPAIPVVQAVVAGGAVLQFSVSGWCLAYDGGRWEITEAEALDVIKQVQGVTVEPGISTDNLETPSD